MWWVLRGLGVRTGVGLSSVSIIVPLVTSGVHSSILTGHAAPHTCGILLHITAPRGICICVHPLVV